MHSREWLMSDNYLQAKIDYEIEEVGDGRRVLIRIQPGERSQRVVLAFERVGGRSGRPQQDHPRTSSSSEALHRSARGHRTAGASTTGNKGTLSAEIDEPRYEHQNAIARVVLPVREGRFTVARVTLDNGVYATTC